MLIFDSTTSLTTFLYYLMVSFLQIITQIINLQNKIMLHRLLTIKVLCVLLMQITFVNAQQLSNKLLGGNSEEFYTLNHYDGEGHPIIVRQTIDGGYVVASATSSSESGDVTQKNHGGNDIWIVKFDISGKIQWQKLIGGNQDELVFQIHQTPDGGYIIGGNSTSSKSGDVTGTSHGDYDFWIVKLNATGDILWDKLLGGNNKEFLSDLSLTTDGGFIATGLSRSGQSGDVTDVNVFDKYMWVVKLTSNGTITWNKLIGGVRTEAAFAIHQTSDGGYIVAGLTDDSNNGDITNTNHGYYDMWLVKINSTGAVQWDKLYGAVDYESIFAMQIAPDGGYILAGVSTSSSNGDVSENNRGGYDAWIVKVDVLGNIIWKRLVGGAGDESIGNLNVNNDGSITLAGYSTSSSSGEITSPNHGENDFWITKFSSLGDIIWTKLYGGNKDDRAYSVIQNREGNYVISGISASSANGDVKDVNKGVTDLWLLTVDPNGVILPTTITNKIDLSLKSFSKNPVVQKDSTGTISFILKNESTTKATNIKVLLKIPYSPPFVIKNSQNCSLGTFDSNMWSVPALAAGDSCILNIVYQPTQTGVWYVQAEIFSSDQEDSDSKNNNEIDTEDDFARSCMSIPIKVTQDTFGMQLMVEDAKLDILQWFKNGIIIQGANKNILQVTTTGKYSYSTKTYICPTQGCCPFILEKDTTPANCCIPLEYILKN